MREGGCMEYIIKVPAIILTFMALTVISAGVLLLAIITFASFGLFVIAFSPFSKDRQEWLVAPSNKSRMIVSWIRPWWSRWAEVMFR
jgi:hypothetical protein